MNYSWEESPFDTKILGFKTAKITYVVGNYIGDIKNDLKKQGIVYATYRVAMDDYGMIQHLEENGFILVDGMMTLGATLAHDEQAEWEFVKEAKPENHQQVIDLSRSVFRGVTRYYHDPVISTQKADSVYEHWLKNSLNGKVADLVLVWEEGEEIFGFITLQKKGHIPLVGVSENARGKGVGKRLLLAALARCKKWGLEEVIIETQMTNIAALRLYHACGFKITASYLTFRWHASSI